MRDGGLDRDRGASTLACMAPKEVDPKLLTSDDFQSLRKGYLRIAADCLLGHVLLSRKVHAGKVMRHNQVHTRVFDTIVPDAFLVRAVSKKCLDNWAGRYREHVVPCKFLIEELTRIAVRDLENGHSREDVLERMGTLLEKGLTIAYLHEEEAKAIDRTGAKTSMPKGSPAIDDPGFDPLARLKLDGEARVEARSVKWLGFVGRARVDEGQIRVQGHRFEVAEPC